MKPGLAMLLAVAGLLVIVSFISPFIAERRMARALMAEGEFLEVFVDTPLAVALFSTFTPCSSVPV